MRSNFKASKLVHPFDDELFVLGRGLKVAPGTTIIYMCGLESLRVSLSLFLSQDGLIFVERSRLHRPKAASKRSRGSLGQKKVIVRSVRCLNKHLIETMTSSKSVSKSKAVFADSEIIILRERREKMQEGLCDIEKRITNEGTTNREKYY